GRVMAGEPQDLAALERNEARDRLPTERDFGLAHPGLGKILAHPGDNLVLLRRQRAPNLNAMAVQPFEGGARVGQVVELDQHVQWDRDRRSPIRGKPTIGALVCTPYLPASIRSEPLSGMFCSGPKNVASQVENLYLMAAMLGSRTCAAAPADVR